MATLEDIYARVPEIECKGLCHGACGPIPATPLEFERMEKAGGKAPGHGADGTCTYLSNGRCAVYADRPLICRLWGVVSANLMRCPHGCRPKRSMPEVESRAQLRQVQAVGGKMGLP